MYPKRDGGNQEGRWRDEKQNFVSIVDDALGVNASIGCEPIGPPSARFVAEV